MKGTTRPLLTPPGLFRVGDRARVRHGFVGSEAEILEDHGPLGVGGRRIYTVQLTFPGPGEPMLTALGEDDLEAVPLKTPDANGTA